MMEISVSKTIEALRQSNDPTGLPAIRHIEMLCELLDKAWDYVDAGEQDKRESWFTEVANGQLQLDLGDRIRQVLDS